MKNIFKIIFVTLSIFISQSVMAATLELNTDKNILNQNQVFNLTINIDTEGQLINTLEGDLKYDSNFLKAESINIGGSFVNFWIEKPNIQTPGLIHLAGMTPGGVLVSRGEVLKVVFRAQKIGDTNLLLNNVNLFINDGQGSKAVTKIKNTSIKINESQVGQEVQSTELIDTVAPEKFNITRTRSPLLFDNKWFVVFDTSDKDSGIGHYKVCELFKCVLSENPSLLRNQTPFYYIVVTAYDMSGNNISSTLVSIWIYILIGALLALILGICVYRKCKSF